MNKLLFLGITVGMVVLSSCSGEENSSRIAAQIEALQGKWVSIDGCTDTHGNASSQTFVIFSQNTVRQETHYYEKPGCKDADFFRISTNRYRYQTGIGVAFENGDPAIEINLLLTNMTRKPITGIHGQPIESGLTIHTMYAVVHTPKSPCAENGCLILGQIGGRQDGTTPDKRANIPNRAYLKNNP
jgi:hypothetical protein